MGTEDQRPDAAGRTARTLDEPADYGLRVGSERGFDPARRPFPRLIRGVDTFRDDPFEVMLLRDLEHGGAIDVKPERGDFDARVLDAQTGEHLTALEVRQFGGRGAVEVEDVENVIGGQGCVSQLSGGFADMHSALQLGEGWNTFVEGDDLAVENGFAMIKHCGEGVDEFGE